MSVAFVQAVAYFQGSPPTTSGSFTPTAGDCIITSAVALASGFTFTYAGTGTYSPVASAYLSGSSATAGFGANTAATAGAQTLSFSSAAGFQQGVAIEYSGVSTITNGSAVEHAAPGTGAGALLGTSVTVPVGSILYCTVWQENGTMSTITNTAGTSRQSASSTLSFNQVEYVGTGAAIQPAFTVGTGTAGFIIVQAILNPSVSYTFALAPGVFTSAGANAFSGFELDASPGVFGMTGMPVLFQMTSPVVTPPGFVRFPRAIATADNTVIKASSVNFLASGANLVNGGAVIAPQGSEYLSNTVDNPLFVQRQ